MPRVRNLVQGLRYKRRKIRGKNDRVFTANEENKSGIKNISNEAFDGQ